jgi:hypothetical protein
VVEGPDGRRTHREDRGGIGRREGRRQEEGIRELRVRWRSGGEVTRAGDGGRQGRSETSESESERASRQGGISDLGFGE